MSSNRDRYGRRKIRPKIRFRFRNIIIIFIGCIVIGLAYYLIKMKIKKKIPNAFISGLSAYPEIFLIRKI